MRIINKTGSTSNQQFEESMGIVRSQISEQIRDHMSKHCYKYNASYITRLILF